MERCNKRSLARGIKRTLEHFDKIVVTKKEECDWMMYAFARLYGIGVIPTIDEDLRTEYTFFNNPEAICNFEKMKLGFDSACVNIFWENADSDLLFRSLHYVTDKLDLRDWRLYLDLNDWEPMTSSRAAIPRARMLDLSTGGPGREALERMRRTSQDVDVDSMYPKLSDSILRYCKEDWKTTMNLYKRMEEKKKNTIKKVIFHDPATIIYWEDGTKTVVKVQNGEKFDPEKGMAMAICKKTHGNDGSYYEAFKKFLPKEEKKTFEFSFDLPEGVDEPTEDNIETPMDLEESTDAVTIDTEAEQYTGEAPRQMCDGTIDDILNDFADCVGLTVTYDSEQRRYYISMPDSDKSPFEVTVESTYDKIGAVAKAELELAICEHFDF